MIIKKVESPSRPQEVTRNDKEHQARTQIYTEPGHVALHTARDRTRATNHACHMPTSGVKCQ